MNESVKRVLEGTITAILVFLVLSNADGFARVAGAAGRVYVGSVKALQGR